MRQMINGEGLFVSGKVLTLALIIGASAAFAVPPQTINLRGQLLDAEGHALSGAREYRVQFYDAATGGTALGAAITGQTGLSSEGLFNIQVTLPPSALLVTEVWYEMAVASGAAPGPLGGGDTFPDRVRIESVPFALESAKVAHVDVSAIGSGTVLDSEFGFLAGLTDGIQKQLDAKAGSADFYTKAQTDTAESAQNTTISSKANAADVYTKTQTDTTESAQNTTISGKANATDVYTKTQTDAAESAQDAAISSKANAADVYTKTEADAIESAQNTAISSKANAADVYTKTQVDGIESAQNTAISSKANAADVYTKTQVDGIESAQNTAISGKANAADVYTKAQVDASQGVQDSAVAAKVAKTGDTMTGALDVTGSYIGVGQAAAPSPVTDRLYNVGGTLHWNGNPAYRFPWTTVPADAQMAGNNGYMVNSTSPVTLTLPASASLNAGDTVRVNGVGTGGWKIAQNASQSILTDTLSISDFCGNWTTIRNNGIFNAVACSADGTTLVVGSLAGIMTSTDSGGTWTAYSAPGPGGGEVAAVASSSNGVKLVALVKNGAVYTSANSGANWTDDRLTGISCVALSSDGTKLVACTQGGPIYTSPDSGVTWTFHGPHQAWSGVASSSDGTKLVACVNGGQIHTSTDSGVTWTPRASVQAWSGVASSSDGTKLIASVNGGQIHTSTDAGATWRAGFITAPFSAVALSSNGDTLAACAKGGPVYTSTNSGGTWNPRATTQQWTGVALSADGTTLLACYQVVSAPGAAVRARRALVASTSAGTGGYICGGSHTALELQYIGYDTFAPLSHEGSLGAN